MIAAGSQQDRDDRDDRSSITRGILKWDYNLFYISAVYGPVPKRFSAK